MWHRLVRHGRHRLKIVDVRELSVNLISSGANAVVNFDGHTVSFIALITDQRRNGRPVFGAAFNSIGRFGQRGILRDRMIPRLLAAEPGALLADSGTELDPAKVLQTIMVGEKPGGHGDRATAAAAISRTSGPRSTTAPQAAPTTAVCRSWQTSGAGTQAIFCGMREHAVPRCCAQHLTSRCCRIPFCRNVIADARVGQGCSFHGAYLCGRCLE